jgi:hypothetical protein
MVDKYDTVLHQIVLTTINNTFFVENSSQSENRHQNVSIFSGEHWPFT